LRAAQTIVSSLFVHPCGQVKLSQVGGGVVVTVVGMKLQHVALSQPPAAHTVSPVFVEYPSEHVKLLQVGAGVVVTVVTTSQHKCAEHSATDFFGSFHRASHKFAEA